MQSDATQGTGTAQEDIEVSEIPPRDNLVRSSHPFEIVRSTSDTMPVLHGRGAVYDEWTEINSRSEGHFMERFAPGAFAKTIAERRNQIRCIFNHGQDPSIGMKPLGPLVNLEDRADGVHYEVQMLDTPYNRDLIPGLEAGLYGSSFRFGITRKNDTPGRKASNGKGLTERTITEAYMTELGPTPFPAYGSTSAGIRSLTDEFVLGRFPAEQLVAAAAATADRDLLAEMRSLADQFVASEDTDLDALRDLMAALNTLTGATEPAPSEDADPVVTSRRSAAAVTTTKPLWGTKEEKPQWLL